MELRVVLQEGKKNEVENVNCQMVHFGALNIFGTVGTPTMGNLVKKTNGLYNHVKVAGKNLPHL